LISKIIYAYSLIWHIIHLNKEHDPDAIPTSRGFSNPMADISLTSRGFCSIVTTKPHTIATSNP